MNFTYEVKWSANSSQRASVGVSVALLKCVLVKRLKVEKRNLGFLLLFVMRLKK